MKSKVIAFPIKITECMSLSPCVAPSFSPTWQYSFVSEKFKYLCSYLPGLLSIQILIVHRMISLVLGQNIICYS